MTQGLLITAPLGKKQRSNQQNWLDCVSQIASRGYDWHSLDLLIERTVNDIKATVHGKNVAFGWSGGKDSLALQVVMRNCGITQCVFAMSNLEYKSFLEWVTLHMPDDLEVINTGQDLDWLVRNPQMLFPQTAAIASKWFKIIQHTGQEEYFRKRKLDMLIVGRRIADGNFMNNGKLYTNRRGITRYSPLAEWSHEDVLATIIREGIELPPTYGWPRGYQVGTGAWPARQWCPSIREGWSEVYQIDQSVVEEAATVILSAREFLDADVK